MARRPFGTTLVQLNVSNTDVQPTRRTLRASNTKHQYAGIRPIAVEPLSTELTRTDNGAAVITVFVSLPCRGQQQHPQLALASSLVVMNSRQFPAYQRAPYIRRRRFSTNGIPNQNPIPGPSSPPNQRPLALQLRQV